MKHLLAFKCTLFCTQLKIDVVMSMFFKSFIYSIICAKFSIHTIHYSTNKVQIFNIRNLEVNVIETKAVTDKNDGPP